VFGTPGPIPDLILGFVLCAVVTLSWIVALIRAKKLVMLPISLWAFAYFLVGFKYAFVRSDPYHILWGVLNIIIPGALVLLVLQGSLTVTSSLIPGDSMKNTVPGINLLTGLTILAAILFLGKYLPDSYRFEGMMQRLGRIPLTFNTARRIETYRQEVAKLRVEHPLPHLEGTVSLFGYQLYLLPAWDLDARPLPALEPIEAHNEYISSRDSERLSGSTAPDHVLFGVEVIDNHFPAIDDSLTWLALLSNYEPAGFCGEYLHLRRSKHPVSIKKTKLLESTLRFGEQLSLPHAAPLWAEVEVSFNDLARIADVFLKLPAIKMQTYNGSAVRNYRIVPGTAKVGFLLSPVIEEPALFATLYEPEIAGTSMMQHVSFGVSPQIGEKLLNAQVRVRIYQLSLQRLR
jgi:hypothetical protein